MAEFAREVDIVQGVWPVSWAFVFKTLLFLSMVAVIFLIGLTRFQNGAGWTFVLSCIGFGLIGLAVWRSQQRG